MRRLHLIRFLAPAVGGLLLGLAGGLIAPTCGTISVLGQRPAAGPAQLARVGFVAQDTSVYARMTVADHLRLDAWLNPGWDHELVRQRITFDLLPTSVLYRGGDRIRIAIADPDSFQLMPANGDTSYRIGHGGTSPSFVELPVMQ